MPKFPARRGDHFYFEGDPYVRVTAALRILDKPGLNEWRIRKALEAVYADPERYATIDAVTSRMREDLDVAGSAGTDAHAAASAYAAGKDIDNPFLPSVKAFFETLRPTPEYAEQPIINRRLRFAGTFDLMATLPSGKRWIFDYKTAKQAYPEHGLQLTAYAMADTLLNEDALGQLTVVGPMPKIDGIAVVLLRREPNFDFVAMPFTPEIFESVLRIWRWRNER